MVLLAAAPFAPVVPVFARMARADLASAAALTGVFPLASALLTPLAAQVALRLLARPDVVRFNIWTSLGKRQRVPRAMGQFLHSKDQPMRSLGCRLPQSLCNIERKGDDSSCLNR